MALLALANAAPGRVACAPAPARQSSVATLLVGTRLRIDGGSGALAELRGMGGPLVLLGARCRRGRRRRGRILCERRRRERGEQDGEDDGLVHGMFQFVWEKGLPATRIDAGFGGRAR